MQVGLLEPSREFRRLRLKSARRPKRRLIQWNRNRTGVMPMRRITVRHSLTAMAHHLLIQLQNGLLLPQRLLVLSTPILDMTSILPCTQLTHDQQGHLLLKALFSKLRFISWYFFEVKWQLMNLEKSFQILVVGKL